MRQSNRAYGVGMAFALLGWAVFAAGGCSNAAADEPTIQVFKTATCGCCAKWIDHLEGAGFEVEAKDLPDLESLKRENGVPVELTSCHTALVAGYVIEGHVPAADIERLLAERPAISGLAVPEMPLGSPGMEHPDPSRHQPFQVMSFGKSGIQVFASHPAH
jgi:hypothetical protein